MVVLKEISESEASELFGSKSSQERQADHGDDNEIAMSSTTEDIFLRQSSGEGGTGSSSSSGQPDLQEESRADDSSAELVDRIRELELKKQPGAGEAILLGALATGVNGPTWFLIKAVLVALAASLILLLHVAIQTSSMMVLFNVVFLIIIAGGLAFGLVWYVSQIGLVTVDKQMAELNLTDEASETGSKKIE